MVVVVGVLVLGPLDGGGGGGEEEDGQMRKSAKMQMLYVRLVITRCACVRG